jgi:hypothetical protein
LDRNTQIGVVVIIIVVAGAAAYFMMQPREPETPTYTLSVGASPVSGITFTLDGQDFVTPYSEELEEDSYTVAVADETTVGGKLYAFIGWEDGVSSLDRSVDLSSDLSLRANYMEIEDEEPEPEPEGPAIISGVVKDAETDDPLEGVNIAVNSESATTASDGTYSLNVTLGSYDVSASIDGYEAEESSVDATEEKTYTLDFSLAPRSVTLQVITRHGADITMKAEQMFLQSEYAERYNIKDIKWMGVSSALWAETIRRKGDIDLGWGGGPVVFDIVYNEGLTAPLVSDEVQEYLQRGAHRSSGERRGPGVPEPDPRHAERRPSEEDRRR